MMSLALKEISISECWELGTRTHFIRLRYERGIKVVSNIQQPYVVSNGVSNSFYLPVFKTGCSEGSTFDRIRSLDLRV